MKKHAMQYRKMLMRIAKITRVEVLNRDDDGILYPKKEWGYTVNFELCGKVGLCPDSNWYNAYKTAYETAIIVATSNEKLEPINPMDEYYVKYHKPNRYAYIDKTKYFKNFEKALDFALKHRAVLLGRKDDKEHFFDMEMHAWVAK